MVSDVEMGPPTSSGFSSPLTPLSTTPPESSVKPTKLDLSDDQLKEINATLNSEWSFYSSLDAANISSRLKSNPSKTNSMSLRDIIDILSTTPAKATFLAPLSINRAETLVQGFNSQELAEWEAGLVKGLKDKDWMDLITHPILRVAPIKTQKLPRGVPIEDREAVIQAWRAEYLGSSHRSLLQAIDKLNNENPLQNYAKIIPMIQSSGTGKSKTLDEIAKERVLFPMCLREEIGEEYFAYPPVDKAVRDYLIRAPHAEDEKAEKRCKDYLRAFLISLFSQALSQAEKFLEETNSYLTLAKKFYELFSDSTLRQNFYSNVIKNTSSVNNNSFLSTASSLKGALLRCSDSPKKSCLIIFGIDEIHVLFERGNEAVRSTHTVFSLFNSVFSEVVDEPVCIVFLSTAGTVSELAPSREVAPSIRLRDKNLTLSTPFTELPFDIDIISTPLQPWKESLSSVGFLKFAVRFGRPMFFTFYKSRSSQQGTTDGTIAKTMLNIIREKLCGFRWPPSKPAAALDPSSFAVLSARLLLDLSPATLQVRNYEENQVRSHLRMLYSVIRNRGVIVTGSSSEPLIAEASAEVMHYSMMDGSAYMDVWALLSNFINDGLIAQDTVGEIIGRVLSILAMDHAIHARADKSELKYQTPVTVAEYYKALLNDTDWDILRLSVPMNAGDLTEEDSNTTFEDAFADAYVHFSHYAKANDDTPLMDRYSWALWLRGTAILCQLNQNLTDRAIPIFFSKLREEEQNVGPDTMSLILDQDKTGLLVVPKSVHEQSAESLCIFSPGNSLPYIDAVHCYALEDTNIRVGVPPETRHHYQSSNLKAPCYRIEISGLGSYRQIPQHHAVTIRALIDGSKNALFLNHPSKCRLSLLRQQQPMLNGSEATTAWFGGFEGQQRAHEFESGEEDAVMTSR